MTGQSCHAANARALYDWDQDGHHASSPYEHRHGACPSSSRGALFFFMLCSPDLFFTVSYSIMTRQYAGLQSW